MPDVLITADAPSPIQPPHLERRTAERYRCSRQRYVHLVARPEMQSLQATVRDFSMRSLGILIDRPIAPGTLLVVQLRSAHSGLSALLSAEVRHATEQGSGAWLLGCTLRRRLNEHEALALL